MSRKLITALSLGLMLVLLTTTAWATNGWQIRMTADNYYWLWVNDPGTGAFLGTNIDAPGGANPANWGTPEYWSPNLSLDRITILVKAENAGSWSSGNPAALLARIMYGNQTIAVTDSSWEYSLDYNPQTQAGTWYRPSVAIGSWNVSPWNTGGYTQPGGALYEAFNGSEAQWIWSENKSPGPQSSPVWFRTTACVPEPMTLILGAMGLGSVAGFRRLRSR